MSIAVGSAVVAPVGLFGLQSLSVATRTNTSIVVTWMPLKTTTESGAVVAIAALIVAYFALREFNAIRKYEYEHGLSREI